MRDMLAPVFGETGAVAAQFIITLIVVLLLVAVVYWLVRRFTGARFGSIARGRVPRLAIVDAMAIDNRRRLVLVRRDNAEHLILIGGPSDVLIEGPIRRVSPRHRAEQQAHQGAQPGEITIAPVAAEQTAEAALPEPNGPAETPTEAASEPPEPATAEAQPPAPPEEARHYDAPPPPPPPPPMPRRRDPPTITVEEVPQAAPDDSAPEIQQPPRRRTSSAQPTNGGAGDHASAQFADVTQPTAIQPMASAAGDETPVVDGQAAESGPQEDHVVATAEATAPEHEAMEESVQEDSGADDATAAKVSDLEREMAKLLGEIGTRRAT